jgi:phage protein D
VDIEKRHNNFYVPAFRIRVGKDQKDLLQLNVEIFSVTVNNTLKGADDFSFTVNNPIDLGADDYRYLKNQLFSVEQTTDITIAMGYGDRSKLPTVFSGIITAVDMSFPANGVSQLTVKGFDRSHKMMKSQHSDSWGSDNNLVKYSDVVKKIADKAPYGFGKSQIVDTREKHRLIKQNRQTDYDFIQKKLADEIGFEVFVRGNDLHFRPRANDSSDIVAELVWGRTLVSFSPKIDTTKQISEVQVRGWDSAQQKAIVGRARRGDEHGKDRGRKSGGEAVAAMQGEVVKYIWKPVLTQKEADDLAKSVLEKTALGYVTGSAESLGIPEIMPGKNIQLSGLGKTFSKIYYIEKVTHTISTSGYKTTFDVTENSI